MVVAASAPDAVSPARLVTVRTSVDILLSPGEGLFFVGEGISKWTVATRMTCEGQHTWWLDVPSSCIGLEFKFVKAPYDLGESFTVADHRDKLDWDVFSKSNQVLVADDGTFAPLELVQLRRSLFEGEDRDGEPKEEQELRKLAQDARRQVFAAGANAVHRDPSVHQPAALEAAWLAARQKANPSKPAVSFAFSGGGCRAMQCAASVLSASRKFIDDNRIQYVAGVSGSTWAMLALHWNWWNRSDRDLFDRPIVIPVTNSPAPAPSKFESFKDGLSRAIVHSPWIWVDKLLNYHSFRGADLWGAYVSCASGRCVTVVSAMVVGGGGVVVCYYYYYYYYS